MSGRQCPLVPAWGSASQSHHVCHAGHPAAHQDFLGYSCWFRKGQNLPAVAVFFSWSQFFNACFVGLQILYTLLQNVAQEETAAQSFYQTYFCDILQHIFSVVTDTSHTAGENNMPVCEAGGANHPSEHQNNATHPVLNNNRVCLPLICTGLTMHASILAYMFNLVEEGKISTPLNPGNPVNNQMFIQEYVANLLKSAFPHLQE